MEGSVVENTMSVRGNILITSGVETRKEFKSKVRNRIQNVPQIQFRYDRKFLVVCRQDFPRLVLP
jgi:hypothetical protein